MASKHNKTVSAYKALKEELPVSTFLHYQKYLACLYKKLKSKIKPYSYIQFAQDLGFGANNILSLVIKGKKPLSAKGGEKMAKVLCFSSQETKYWLTLIEFNNAKDPGLREKSLRKLLSLKGKQMPSVVEESQLRYFSEWYHPVIRELARRNDFKMDPRWIQDQLTFPLRIEEIKKSMELLTKLGLICYSPKLERYTSSDEVIDTGPEARGIAFIGYQQRMIELGKESIARVDKKRRELVSATLTLPPEAIEELKLKIHQLIKDACALEATDGALSNQVSQFNIQLFPHVKPIKKDRGETS